VKEPKEIAMERTDTIERIPLAKIDRVPHRRTSWGDIEGLAASIRALGQDTPALVRRKAGGRFELVRGERRLRACELAGIDTLRAEVVEISEADAHDLRIVENNQREDLSPLEEGESFSLSIDRDGRSINEIAARIGRSPAYVEQRLRLLTLDPRIRTLVEEDRIAHDGAIALAQLPARQQREVADDLRRIADAAPGERISARAVADLMDGRWHELASAPFDPTDGSLCSSGRVCRGCPSNSESDPQQRMAFLEVRGVCLDSSCYGEKVSTTWDRKSAAAKAAGLVVIQDDQKARDALAADSPFVKLDGTAHYRDLNGKPTLEPTRQTRNGIVEHEPVTYRELLGGAGEGVTITLVRDPSTGGAIEVVSRSMARQALIALIPAAKDLGTTVSEHVRGAMTDEEREAAREERLKAKANAQGLDAAIRELVAKVEADPKGDTTLRQVVVSVIRNTHHGVLREVCVRRGYSMEEKSTGAVLPPKEVLLREQTEMSGAALSALLVDITASVERQTYEQHPKGSVLAALFEAREVDAKRLIREAERELRGVKVKRRKKKTGGDEADAAAE
jgi:ParB/RepB/Spo0J family partition protein